MKRTLTRASRAIWLVVGLLALGLGFLGIFLPLLPTTPLILLAAFAFANSSERLHRWLLEHDVFGQMIANWQRHGAISKRAKTTAVVSMLVVLAVSVFMNAPAYIIATQVIVLGATSYFVLSRPTPPGE